MGITTLHSFSGSFSVLNAFTVPFINIAGMGVNALMVLAGVMAAATIVVLNSNAITDRGIAMLVFTGVFWSSLSVASLSLLGIILHFVIFGVFWSIFMLACTLIFFNALVQFPTGGQGAHV
jgi:hypothetical protein